MILSIFIRQRSTCYVNVNDCSRFNFIQRLREFSKYLGSMIFTLFKHRKKITVVIWYPYKLYQFDVKLRDNSFWLRENNNNIFNSIRLTPNCVELGLEKRVSCFCKICKVRKF